MAMKPITGHLAHTHTRQEDHTMVVVECGDHGWWLLCVVVLVLVVNHTLWLCLCGGVGCGDHEWWHLALHQASHASAHCVALLL